MGGTTTISYDASGNPISTTVSRTGGNSVTATGFDAMNRLLSITDPLGQITQYEYADTENPMLPTRIVGPTGVVAGAGSANQMAFQWGKRGSGHLGKLEQVTGPNLGAAGFFYDGSGNSVNSLASSESTACNEYTGAADRSQTGEAYITGGEDDCGFVARRPAPRVTEALQAQCIEGPTDCPICGCQRAYDEAGNLLDLVSDEIPGEEACSNSAVASTAGNEPFPYSVCDNGHHIDYDGNSRLICAIDGYQGRQSRSAMAQPGNDHPVKYDLSYDGRGRMTSYRVRAFEGAPLNDPFATNPPSPYPYVYVFPTYKLLREYSDTLGEFRTMYCRSEEEYSINPDPCVSGRKIITVYKTDLAGRIISVQRGNADPTTYAYPDDDANRSLPSVEETRPDHTKTLVYLNMDGSVSQIKHLDALGGVLASYTYTRDLKGRVTRVAEEIKVQTGDGFRNETVDYEYGDGNLTFSDLDEPQDPNNPQPIPQLGKLYYAFLNDLGAGHALKESDPNRLVKERRSVTDGSSGTPYHREYRYDPGGNRLVMIEYDPAGERKAVTRYNYYYYYVAGVGTPTYLPGTPIVRGTPRMDYAGGGRDKLYSSQTYYPQDPNRMDFVLFGYADGPDHPEYRNPSDDDSMTYRVEATWLRRESAASPGTFGWYKSWERSTVYSYFNGQIEGLTTSTDDYCAVGGCQTCTAAEDGGGCTDNPDTKIHNEFHNFDIFGRRVNRTVCDQPCDVTANPEQACPTWVDVFQRCKMDHTQYDYDGLSNQVLVERRGPYRQNIIQSGGQQPYPATYDGDRYLSSYTYGPLGAISRTVENDDNDPSNNRDQYYLRDAMGGHVGILDPAISSEPAFTVYDAFGNNMSAGSPSGGSFAWRGREGSVTDREPNLIHMQARHYDPTLGRFIQADTLVLASPTTQGMNRYIYCENDPVNGTDPTGMLSPQTDGINSIVRALLIFFLMTVALTTVGELTALVPLILLALGIIGAVLSIAANLVYGVGRLTESSRCLVAANILDKMSLVGFASGWGAKLIEKLDYLVEAADAAWSLGVDLFGDE